MKIIKLGSFAINVDRVQYMSPNMGNNRTTIYFGDERSVTVDGSLEEVLKRINELTE
jgi:hypothetical protein